jgi:hypothetical protein
MDCCKASQAYEAGWLGYACVNTMEVALCRIQPFPVTYAGFAHHTHSAKLLKRHGGKR